jgi:hypothetical protein
VIKIVDGEESISISSSVDMECADERREEVGGERGGGGGSGRRERGRQQKRSSLRVEKGGGGFKVGGSELGMCHERTAGC